MIENEVGIVLKRVLACTLNDLLNRNPIKDLLETESVKHGRVKAWLSGDADDHISVQGPAGNSIQLSGTAIAEVSDSGKIEHWGFRREVINAVQKEWRSMVGMINNMVMGASMDVTNESVTVVCENNQLIINFVFASD